MSETKTASEQLAEAMKAAEDAAARVKALKQQTRDEDLKTVKALITTHAFEASDLKPALKQRRSKRRSDAGKPRKKRKAA